MGALQLVLLTLLALQHVFNIAHVGAAAAAGAGSSSRAALQQPTASHPRSLLQANSNSTDSGSEKGNSSGTGSSTSANGTRTVTNRKGCRPSLIDVARTQPELRQIVQLAAMGYNLFSVDGGKNFTVLVPNNAALQALAAGIQSQDEEVSLENGFYSVVLYHQIPQGALNTSQLLSLGYNGLQTSLGRALGSTDDKYTVSVDGSTRPVVATGGWPANNAQLLGSYEACNGWLYVLDAVLLPTQTLSDLPHLVDEAPNLQNGSIWGLLDGSGMGEFVPAPSSANFGAPGDGGGDSSGTGGAHHSNSTDIAVSSGNGGLMPATSDDASTSSASSSTSSGNNEKVLVIAASVAGAAVAACAVVVAVVLLRKHAAQRRHKLGRLEALTQQEEEADFSPSPKRATSCGPSPSK